jgi:hypothetical protein
MIKINAFSRVLNQKVKTRCFFMDFHYGCFESFPFRQNVVIFVARSRDFDGMHPNRSYSAILATLPIIYNYMAE